MAGYENQYEKYWADEENQLRKRGIDPMQVPQKIPPKLPTNPGNTTLHAKGGLIGSSPTRTDHVNKSYKMASGGFVPAFIGSAAQAMGSDKQQQPAQGTADTNLGPATGGVIGSAVGGDDEDENKPQAGPYAPNSPGRMGSNR